MTQEIFTIIIVGLAAGAALWKLYRRFVPATKKEDCGKPQFDGGSGCGSCAADCPLKPGTPPPSSLNKRLRNPGKLQ